MSLRVALLGLGEAGGEIAADLVAAGADVRGYDPKVRPGPGIDPRDDEADAVRDAELVLSANSSHDAAVALGNAKQVTELNTALQTRKVIGQALGILMERYRMDEDRAFAFLVRTSSHENVKLHTLAQHLVDEANATP